jgi:hypothetical protein
MGLLAQDLVAALLALAAAAWLVWRRRRAAARGGGACASCEGCAPAPPRARGEVPLIGIGEPSAPARPRD